MKLRLSTVILFITGFFIVSPSHTTTAEPLKIAAVVNNEIISSQDIKNRLNLFLMTTQIPFNPQTQNMIYSRVLNNAIEEKIKLQAASKEDIKISPQELAQAIKDFEKSNNISAGNLKNILKQNNVTMSTFENQMKSDMAWIRLVKRKMFMDSKVTQKELETAMEEAKKDLSTPKYFVSEIYISKKDAKDLSVLVDNLRQDPRFELYAMQFSQSATAANGGRLGWLNRGRFPEPIEQTLQKMHEGEISDPILYGDGYYIVRLDKTFDPKTDNASLPSSEEMRKFLENQKMEEFSKKHLQDLHQQAVIELRS